MKNIFIFHKYMEFKLKRNLIMYEKNWIENLLKKISFKFKILINLLTII